LKALLIDNDMPTLEALTYNLLKRGHMVCTASDGQDGLDLAWGTTPDVVVLDIVLPSIDGLEVCRNVRSVSSVPIVFLSARATETDKLLGMDAGADDFFDKPFSMPVLMAKLEAIANRSGQAIQGNVHAGEVHINVSRHEVFIRGNRVDLKPLQFKLLHFLASHPGRVYSRQDLMREVWGKPTASTDSIGKTVDVQVHELRDLVEIDPSTPKIIRTVQRIGFKFDRDDLDEQL